MPHRTLYSVALGTSLVCLVTYLPLETARDTGRTAVAEPGCTPDTMLTARLSSSQTNKRPRTTPVRARLSERYFDTLNAVLSHLAAEQAGVSRRKDSEHVGALYQTAAGGYTYSVGIGHRGQDAVRFSVPRQPDLQLIAYWHTHGARGWFRDVFSETDAALVRQTGKPFYLLTPDSTVVRLDHEAARKPAQRHVGTRSALRNSVRGYSGIPVKLG